MTNDLEISHDLSMPLPRLCLWYMCASFVIRPLPLGRLDFELLPSVNTSASVDRDVHCWTYILDSSILSTSWLSPSAT